MTRTELAQLLTIASLIDHRKITQETVEAWFEVIGDMDFALAREAMILARQDTSIKYLEPRHLIRHGARVELLRWEDVRAAKALGIVPASWPGHLPLLPALDQKLHRAQASEEAEKRSLEMRDLMADIEQMPEAEQLDFLPILKGIES